MTAVGGRVTEHDRLIEYLGEHAGAWSSRPRGRGLCPADRRCRTAGTLVREAAPLGSGPVRLTRGAVLPDPVAREAAPGEAPPGLRGGPSVSPASS